MSKTTSTVSTSVYGLEGVRERAGRRAARRRFKNTVVSGLAFLLIAGALGAGGYYGWHFYRDEQAKDVPSGSTMFTSNTEEIIEHLDSQPKWNGPGNPTFGVGQDPAP